MYNIEAASVIVPYVVLAGTSTVVAIDGVTEGGFSVFRVYELLLAYVAYIQGLFTRKIKGHDYAAMPVVEARIVIP